MERSEVYGVRYETEYGTEFGTALNIASKFSTQMVLQFAYHLQHCGAHFVPCRLLQASLDISRVVRLASECPGQFFGCIHSEVVGSPLGESGAAHLNRLVEEV